MSRKCYISFKTEDFNYKYAIQSNPSIDIVDKSLDRPVESTNEDYIMRCIREDYLADSTVTIHLIGTFSAEARGAQEQRFIKRELQASLYNAAGNTRNGVLGVVLPQMHEAVFQGSYSCSSCGGLHQLVSINDHTVVREFSYNYYLPNGKCSHTEDERYCVLVGWADFVSFSDFYIDQAFAKRTEPIAAKVRVFGC